MAEWFEFALALTAFLLSHLIPARPGLRAALVARLGRAGYGAGYGILSLLLLVWVIAAAGRAPVVPLWDQEQWMRWLVNLAMPLAVLLVCLAIGAANPLSFGGKSGGFDPARPGIAGVVRHPLLWALLLWASGHMLVNGDLAHVILFGVFAGYALLGMGMIDRRKQAQWGRDMWITRASGTGAWPFGGNWRCYRPAWWRVALAACLWLALLHLHEPVIGVMPAP
ncbi:NnrU family protein [Gemmobacter serpentinus]|uniref:NnrU family protein n=1 Tax=Gemmobacter serpentinus TaxID=2652247 RepID=UPI00124E6CEF|nr:NnrU family protein [Gemmobacter serpentinus]